MLTNDELLDVKAGAINFGTVSLIIAGITFIIGVVDGYFRPLKCNK